MPTVLSDTGESSMSRRRPRRNERDAFAIANPPSSRKRLLRDVELDIVEGLPRLPFMPAVRASLSEIADGRNWDPDIIPRSPSFRSRVSSVQPVGDRNVNAGRSQRSPSIGNDLRRIQNMMQFANPKFVLRCVRRKIRDEVLHALKKTGKGSGKPRRFNEWSKVRC